MPVSRFTRVILRPRMPPRLLSSCTAALSELVVTVPMKAPIPENGAITPTLRVSPLAPPIFLAPPPEPHAASTAPERRIAAAEPMPALPAHSMNFRREMSLLTWRSMKSRSCSGFMVPVSLSHTPAMLCRQMWTGNPRMPRVNHRGNASLPALLHSDGRIPPRTLRAFDPPRSIPRVTSTAEDLRDVRPRRQQISMALAVAATLPALILRLGGGSLDHPFEAIAFGGA